MVNPKTQHDDIRHTTKSTKMNDLFFGVSLTMVSIRFPSLRVVVTIITFLCVHRNKQESFFSVVMIQHFVEYYVEHVPKIKRHKKKKQNHKK